MVPLGSVLVLVASSQQLSSSQTVRQEVAEKERGEGEYDLLCTVLYSLFLHGTSKDPKTLCISQLSGDSLVGRINQRSTRRGYLCVRVSMCCAVVVVVVVWSLSVMVESWSGGRVKEATNTNTFKTHTQAKCSLLLHPLLNHTTPRRRPSPRAYISLRPPPMLQSHLSLRTSLNHPCLVLDADAGRTGGTRGRGWINKSTTTDFDVDATGSHAHSLFFSLIHTLTLCSALLCSSLLFSSHSDLDPGVHWFDRLVLYYFLP